MASLASDWLRYFRLLLSNCWREFNETWKGSKISASSAKFVFFGPSGKTRSPPWPLIGWDIFDFSSETAEQNSTKLDGKQDLNVLYQVCVFRADRKNKMAALASDGWDIFDFSSETAEWNLKKLDRKQISTSSTKFVFFGPLSKQKCPPWLIPQKGGTLYSGARYVALWASCLRIWLFYVFIFNFKNYKECYSVYTCRYKTLVSAQICSSFLHKLHVYIVDLQFLNIWEKDTKVFHKYILFWWYMYFVYSEVAMEAEIMTKITNTFTAYQR